MEENNLGPSASQWVQVGVHVTNTTVSQTGECGVGSQGSSYLRQDRKDDREGRSPGVKGRMTDGFSSRLFVVPKKARCSPC